MGREEIQLLIGITSFILLIIITALVVIFYVFQKRKTEILIEKAKQAQEFQKEINKTQIEIQEQTLKAISWELHDNIGQLLSAVKMQLNFLELDTPILKNNLKSTSDVVQQCILEVRQLSHNLNTDHIAKVGLQKAIENELNRYKRFGTFEIHFESHVDEYVEVDSNSGIIIFRIFQECLVNVSKYAQAENLYVKLNYYDTYVNLIVEDDGVGFDVNNTEDGTGLNNIKKRAEMIMANVTINSEIEKGTQIKLKYPYMNKKIITNDYKMIS
ncbi:sensor histidine kinase [Zhouia sp. PK063]|uniref:sensor histidine kinase n=1 Tax=Zhouia sp. PK063 TaxID=3373602 RepID=UPI0037A49EA9